MGRWLISVFALLLFIPLGAQDVGKGRVMQFVIDSQGDTIYVDELPPAFKYTKPPRGKKGKKWRDYYKLVHNFAKSYPYALLAEEVLRGADDYIEGNDLNRRKRTLYISRLQDTLFRVFEKPLKNLTVTQGALLLRLIDRETGLPPYDILKKYKNRAAAGFWQGIAKLFGSDMKRRYDPNGADKDVEELVGIYQRGEFNYLYVTIFGMRPPEPVQRAKHDYPQRYGY